MIIDGQNLIGQRISPRRARFLERGLSIDRAERFPDMNALLRALVDHPRRRPGRTVALVAAGALALAGTAALLRTWRLQSLGAADAQSTRAHGR